MLPTVFLSLSGQDRDFVERVASHLPEGQAFFYPQSFENGENLVTAMERRVGQATVFALFASKASAASHWVNFEIDRARISSIVNKSFRVLVFPIDRDVRHTDLPAWMSEYWIPSPGLTARDIARYLQNTLAYQGIITTPTGRGYGRGELVDSAVHSVTNTVVETGSTPNVFIFSGVNGIGRRTVSRQFLEAAFPAAPDLTAGPVLDLPQFPDLDEIYRALRQEVDPAFSLSRFAQDLEAFRKLDPAQKIEEIIVSMNHFFGLGQAVLLVLRHGLFEDRGTLKSWAPLLFDRMAREPKGKLILISSRHVHENELRPHRNVLQLQVPQLKDEVIKSIIIVMVPAFGGKAALPSDEIVRAIGGHPAIAKLTSRLIAQHGPSVLDDDPKSLFNIQDEVLRESVQLGTLGDIKKEILSILSWLPSVPVDTLRNIISYRHSLDRPTFAETMSDLILSCLVEPSGDSFTIAGPIRSFFRRHYGYGAPDLRAALYEELKTQWQKAQLNDQLRVEVFDSIVFMAALEGGTLPTEFRALLMPATLQELVRETYDNGHDDDESLRRVVTWGKPAVSMTMNEATREEILSLVVRAMVRLRTMDDQVDELLHLFERKGYRSVHYLRGFYLRRRGKSKEAIAHLLEARNIGKYMRALIGELADCYKVCAMWDDLRGLISEQTRYIDRNPYLLDIYAGTLIAEKNWDEAEKVIARLRAAGRADGRAECRTASLMMQRDGAYKKAAELLANVLSRVPNGRDNVRRMRALAAANSGDFDTARDDAAQLKDRPGGLNAVRKIEATILFKQQSYDRALEVLKTMSAPSAQDRLLEAKILEAKATDPLTPLAEKEALRQQATALRARYGIVDEFESDL